MKFSRRQLIKSAGAWALLAPILMSKQVGALPSSGTKRVVILFSPNGPIIERGPILSGGTETNFELHPWWSPLERHKQDGFFFDGLHQAGVPFGEHNEYGHQSAGTGALTARTTEKTNNSTGPSIDQFIGQKLQEKGILTPRRSALWGLHDNAGNWGPWYEDAGKPVAPTHNPYDALAGLLPFLGSGSEIKLRQDALRRKRFVLDHAYQDCKALYSYLDSEGKALMDFHCANIEALEQSVAASIREDGPTCAAPSGPATTLGADANFKQASTRDEAMNAFVEMTALAFGCDLTRVVGLSFGSTASRFAIPEAYNIPSSEKVDSGDSGPQHHAWTHVNPRTEAKELALKGFTMWYAQWVARLIDKLKATPDVDGGSLFDSTLVFWTSELGFGGSGSVINPHPNNNIPVVLFGGGPDLKAGRAFTASGDNKAKAMPIHQLYVSMIRHMGLPQVDTFGNAGQGPLDWLQG